MTTSSAAELNISGELKTMLEVLIRLDKAHRIVQTFDNGVYVVVLEVGEACMTGGWMPVKDLAALVAWLAPKH